MDLNTIYAQVEHFTGPVTGIAFIVGFLIDKAPTMHRIAKILRWIANILDAAPKVSQDVKSGEIQKAVEDVREIPPVTP